ncbi:MAG: biotin transporter BioY [Actinomycetota bacterium]|nr:biotin transporter BioY [Actinomycetota bacterium]
MHTTYPSRTIASVLVPRTAVSTIALMIGFALFTALAAQIRFYLPGTPVPITAQTFAVLLSGAVLGSRSGAGSQLIYWLMGAIGLPVFAQTSGGWAVATGATFGYLLGFIVAAWVVGTLAERGGDRSVRTAIPAFLAGNAIIYLFGVPWLMLSVPSIDTLAAALAAGLAPFVVGDLIKIVGAGLALPTAWKLTERNSASRLTAHGE